MRLVENSQIYHGADDLAIMAGWKASHRSLEAEAAEVGDMAERDHAARTIFARSAAK